MKGVYFVPDDGMKVTAETFMAYCRFYRLEYYSCNFHEAGLKVMIIICDFYIINYE
jgi:hypothetical protein